MLPQQYCFNGITYLGIDFICNKYHKAFSKNIYEYLPKSSVISYVKENSTWYTLNHIIKI